MIRRSCIRGVLVAIAATALLITCAGAQQANKELRKRAFELYDQHRVEQALPLLEKLADANPKDVQVLEALGMAILHRSSVAKDVEACRREKARARKVLLQAKELGDNSNLLQVVLEGLPENAECKPYSDRSEADESMRKAEAAFGRGDLDEALRWYVQTIVLDPNNYHAALYAGDAYFKKGQYGSSGEWYARAIQIDPNHPTAYRYWGDSLMRAGKLGEARHKFVDAVVVAPFLQASWIGLRQWADRAGYDLVNPRIESPLKETEKDGAKTITIDAGGLKSGDGQMVWLVYAGVRAAWQKELFSKEYPGEKQYRHSLKEEAAALAAVANAATEGIASGRLKQVDASLSNLLRLRDKGLIEPYVFIARGDAGIANDYEGYRRQHAEKVRQYIEEEVLLPKLTDEAERRADGKRVASRPEERGKAIDLIRRVEEDPLGPDAQRQRAWVTKFLTEIPDVSITVCNTIPELLGAEKESCY